MIGADSGYSNDSGDEWFLDRNDLPFLTITGELGTIPEPSAYTSIASLGALAVAMVGRRRRTQAG